MVIFKGSLYVGHSFLITVFLSSPNEYLHLLVFLSSKVKTMLLDHNRAVTSLKMHVCEWKNVVITCSTN